MANYFETLGLEKGASQEDIKRAYFKLVRRHSPEKDPEGFRKIRKAYEELQKGGYRDEPDFAPLSHPYGEYYEKQIRDCLENVHYERARDTAEEAVRLFPADLVFLYLLVIAQRNCDNTGKAVKNAELLVKKDPENRWFLRELGVSCMARGFIKKARPAMEKAYALGCRDLEFIYEYARCREDYADKKETKKILEEKFFERQSISSREFPDYISICRLLLTEAASSEEKQRVFHQLCTMYMENKSAIREYLSEYLSFLMMTGEELKDDLTGENYTLEIKMLKSIRSSSRTEEQRTMLNNMISEAFYMKMEKDDRLCRAAKHWYDMPDTPDQVLKTFALLDCQLCMIEERKEVLSQEEYIKESYPDLYKEMKNFLEQMKEPGDIQELKERLQKKYRQMEPSISGGRYYEWYPAEKVKVYGTLRSADTEKPFVRSSKKISRNDPCPCGSGKKFKQCCMGKGIYD